jgi:long-subunit fatty acid transport protein
MTTNTEDYAGTRSVESPTMDQLASSGNSYKYQLYAPWHFLVSGSYIFPGELTQGKMGFITADIEYQTNISSKFSFQPDDGNQQDNSYYDPLNSVIRSFYKNTFNFRLGGEYKVDELAFRLGGSYSMNPYSSPDLKVNRATVSGGLGYRKHGIFIDLTYVEAILHDVNFPYHVSEKDNVFSTVNTYAGNIVLTVGMKF